MQKTISLLKRENELTIIDTPLDINLEISHLAYAEVKKDDGGKALLFTNVMDGDKKFDEDVVMNLFGSYKRCELIFGKGIEDVANEIETLLHMKPPSGFGEKISMAQNLFSLKNIFPKRSNKKGACQEVIFEGDDINLKDLPILKTWEQDGGAFITMGQVYTQSFDGELQNLGMYRLQVYDNKTLGMHWQIHKDASHFFDQYQKAGKNMPVSIAIGGDPLYTWCATAPLPYGVNELLLYGFIKKEPAKLVKSITNDIYIPSDVDYVIEGWVDPSEMKVEGPFGDHTGYYTLEEPYPSLEVSAITKKRNSTFVATVVGKPPLEDKYMGWPTERIFLPLLKTTAPALVDYHMPENGVFHNLILAKMETHYRGHAKQFMHVFWGAGQMSFVKQAIFLDDNAPKLTNYEVLTAYILNRFTSKSIFISEGINDALDHSSDEALVGGKLGIDVTASRSPEAPTLLSDDKLLEKIKECVDDAVSLHQHMRNTKNPITLISVNKTKNAKDYFKSLKKLKEFMKIVVFIDHEANDVQNAYMSVWRVVNNMDAQRDVFMDGEFIGIDGTNKNELDGFKRRWPDDVNCTLSVVNKLKKLGLWNLDESLEKKYQLY